jgi:hypothetical protein
MMKLPILMLNLKFAKMSEKMKFARVAYTIGRYPSIKDGLGFQKGTKELKSQRASNLIKEKGKAPLASSSHSFHDNKNHAYLYAHVKDASNVSHVPRHDVCYDHIVLPMRHDAVFNSHAMIVSSRPPYVHGRSRPRRHVHNVVSHVSRNAPNGQTMLYHTYDASYVLHCKNDKVVAKNVGPKCKGKTCIWILKSYVTNLVGPNKSWVPKSQA